MWERQGLSFTPSPGRSFAIPAFISLNRPQGALDFDSKYNVGRWLEDDQRDGRNGCTKLLPRLSSYSPR